MEAEIEKEEAGDREAITLSEIEWAMREAGRRIEQPLIEPTGGGSRRETGAGVSLSDV